MDALARAAARSRPARAGGRARELADEIAFVALRAVAFRARLAGAARLRARARRRAHRRHPDLRRARQRRRLAAPRALHLDDDGRADVDRRRAARLLQRDRPALGQPALPLGRACARTGYAWWIARFRATLARFDAVRLDHFIGFARYWEIPASEPTAVNGRWRRGPGRALLRGGAPRARRQLPLIAEDLGAVTPEVKALRDRLRAARDQDPAVRVRHRSARARLPAAQLPAQRRRLHRHARQRHDRRLVPRSGQRHAHRRADRERNGARVPGATSAIERRARDPLGHDPRDRACRSRTWRSFRCRTCSGLGSEARMNRPGIAARQLGVAPARRRADARRVAERLRELTATYGRDERAQRMRRGTLVAAARRRTAPRRRSALVQGRDHLRAARPLVPRQQRRRHRRLPRPDAEARLPAGPRRHGDLAAAVLPVAAARRRLRHRRLHRRPSRRTARSTTSSSSSTRRTGAACASSPSWSSTTPPTSTRGSSARGARRRAAPSATSTSGATRPSSTRDARIIFKDFEPSNWTWDPVAKAYYWHRFYAHQPDLNFDNPAVHEAMLDVVDFWLDMGVDGLRLDAVPYLYEREGTNCENLPETHEFLKKLRAHVDAQVPGPHAARRGEPVARGRRRLLRRRRRVPHGVPLPAHAAAVHGDSHGGPLPDHRHPRSRRRRSRRTASGRCSCATTTS